MINKLTVSLQKVDVKDLGALIHSSKSETTWLVEYSKLLDVENVGVNFLRHVHSGP